jgi:hypothetical protein
MPSKRDAHQFSGSPNNISLTLITSLQEMNAVEEHDSTVESPQFLQYPWPKSLSLDDLHGELRAQAGRIIQQRQALMELGASLRLEEPPLPADYDKVLSALQALIAVMYQLCRLMDGTAHLPLVVIPLRYPLVVIAHKLIDQVDGAMQTIIVLKGSRRAGSKTAAKRRAEMQRNLIGIDINCDYIDQEIARLIDRTNLRQYLFAS